MPWPRPGHWDPFEVISVDRSGRLHQALAAMLKDKSLKELVLWQCQVGDVGAQASGVLLFWSEAFSIMFLKFR